MSNTLKRIMLRISFQDVERGLQEAKPEATTYFATGLVSLENRLHHRELLRNDTALTASAHGAEASIYTLESDIRECRSRPHSSQSQALFSAKNGLAEKYDFPAQLSLSKRYFDDETKHPPFDFLWNPCTLRSFLSPLSHLRDPPRREVTSMNTFNKKTPIAATSTANPRSLSASKATDSATSSPTGPFPFRSSSDPRFGRSWNPRLSSRNQRPSSPLS